ncbi:hypothetical protein QUF80_05570 [Desulfococcaceae bacterium HSG8]|nr:hypothetical protein [Desulfococcaceae bacterium HSG8]
MISNKKHTGSEFVVPPSGGITPPEGGTTNRTWYIYILFWKSPKYPAISFPDFISPGMADADLGQHPVILGKIKKINIF